MPQLSEAQTHSQYCHACAVRPGLTMPLCVSQCLSAQPSTLSGQLWMGMLSKHTNRSCHSAHLICADDAHTIADNSIRLQEVEKLPKFPLHISEQLLQKHELKVRGLLEDFAVRGKLNMPCLSALQFAHVEALTFLRTGRDLKSSLRAMVVPRARATGVCCAIFPLAS